MDNWEKIAAKLKRLEGEIERLKTIEQPVTAISGWIEVSGWSYASATTITVPSGAASIYAVGDQIRLKQGGAYKYFYIITVADTLLTVTGGSDYSVANAAITDAAFSKGGGVGHPRWFNWTPTYSADASMTYTSVTTNIAIFSVEGRMLTMMIDSDGTIGGTVNSRVLFTTPFAISMTYYCTANGNPGGSWGNFIAFVYYDSTRIAARRHDLGNWSTGINKQFRGTCICSI